MRDAALAWSLQGTFETVDSAAHFMISTHANEVAGRIADNIRRGEAQGLIRRR